MKSAIRSNRPIAACGEGRNKWITLVALHERSEEQTWHSHGVRRCFVRVATLGQRRPHESFRAGRNENYWIAAGHPVARRISSQRLRSGDILCGDGEVSNDMYSNTTAGTVVAAESG